jgi:Icc protein
MSSINTKDPIRLVQITDTHLYGKPTGTLLKMNTHESLDYVVDLVKGNEERIDFILATGDIAQDGSPSAYEHFIKTMAELDAPFTWIPGNHDKPAVMVEVGGERGYCEKNVRLNNWQLVFLDTSVEGQVHGRLSEAELDFLRTSLERAEVDADVAHVMVCLHHNPTKGNAGWMKDIGLHNGEEFFAILSGFTKVRSVVYGHIHQELDYDHKGIRCLCTPSTCIQFKPNVSNFELDRSNPGYRTLQLHANGDIDSRVYRVEGFEFEADFNSTGY